MGKGFLFLLSPKIYITMTGPKTLQLSLGLMFQVGSLPELISIRHKKDEAGAGFAHSTVFLYFSQSAFNSSSQCFNCVQFSSPQS